MEPSDAEFEAAMNAAVAAATAAVTRMDQGYFVRFYDLSRDCVSYRYADQCFRCEGPGSDGDVLLAGLGLTEDTHEIPLSMVVAFLKGPTGPRAQRVAATAKAK